MTGKQQVLAALRMAAALTTRRSVRTAINAAVAWIEKQPA